MRMTWEMHVASFTSFGTCGNYFYYVDIDIYNVCVISIRNIWPCLQKRRKRQEFMPFRAKRRAPSLLYGCDLLELGHDDVPRGESQQHPLDLPCHVACHRHHDHRGLWRLLPHLPGISLRPFWSRKAWEIHGKRLFWSCFEPVRGFFFWSF